MPLIIAPIPRVNGGMPAGRCFERPMTLLGPAVTAALIGVGSGSVAPAQGAIEGKQHDAVQIAPEVVVTATFAPIAPKKVGSAITVITADDIEQRQATSVPELLRDVPGLAVNRSGPSGGFTQIRMRGTEANQVLFLIDGVEANDPATSEPLWADILPMDIERIEVLRGSQSSIHGSDAIGGVINIITKKGKGRPQITAAAEVGSFETFSGKSGFSGGGDKYHYALNVGGYSTLGVSESKTSSVNPEPNDRDGYKNITVSTKLGATPFEDLDIQVTGRFIRSRNLIDNFSATDGPDQIDTDRETRRKQFFGGVKGQYSLFDDAWEHIARAEVTEVRAKTFQDGAFAQFTKSVGRKVKLAYHTNIHFDLEFLADSSHTVTLGLDTEHEKDITDTFKKARDTDGFFAEYQLELLDRLTLTGSGRYDRNDIFKNSTTWRATAAFRIEEIGTKLRASYATGVKNPTFFELFGGDDDFSGNPDLQPERNRGVDFGIDQSLFEDAVVLEGTLFFNRVEGLITGSGNTSRNQDGTTKIWGVELSVGAEITEDLWLNGSYTYTNHKDATGQELLRRAKHIASANVHYALLDNRAQVYLGVDFNGNQADTDFTPTFARNRVELDAFANVTLGGTYRLSERFKLNARIENLLDDQYEEVFGFQGPGLGVFIGLSGKL